MGNRKNEGLGDGGWRRGEERRKVASGSGQQLPSWVGESWRGADDDGEIKRLTALMTVMGRIGRLRRAHELAPFVDFCPSLSCPMFIGRN